MIYLYPILLNCVNKIASNCGHIETQTNQVLTGAYNTNPSIAGGVRQQCERSNPTENQISNLYCALHINRCSVKDVDTLSLLDFCFSSFEILKKKIAYFWLFSRLVFLLFSLFFLTKYSKCFLNMRTHGKFDVSNLKTDPSISTVKI